MSPGSKIGGGFLVVGATGVSKSCLVLFGGPGSASLKSDRALKELEVVTEYIELASSFRGRRAILGGLPRLRP